MSQIMSTKTRKTVIRSTASFLLTAFWITSLGIPAAASDAGDFWKSKKLHKDKRPDSSFSAEQYITHTQSKLQMIDHKNQLPDITRKINRYSSNENTEPEWRRVCRMISREIFSLIEIPVVEHTRAYSRHLDFNGNGSNDYDDLAVWNNLHQQTKDKQIEIRTLITDAICRTRQYKKWLDFDSDDTITRIDAKYFEDTYNRQLDLEPAAVDWETIVRSLLTVISNNAANRGNISEDPFLSAMDLNKDKSINIVDVYTLLRIPEKTFWQKLNLKRQIENIISHSPDYEFSLDFDRDGKNDKKDVEIFSNIFNDEFGIDQDEENWYWVQEDILGLLNHNYAYASWVAMSRFFRSLDLNSDGQVDGNDAFLWLIAEKLPLTEKLAIRSKISSAIHYAANNCAALDFNDDGKTDTQDVEYFESVYDKRIPIPDRSWNEYLENTAQMITDTLLGNCQFIRARIEFSRQDIEYVLPMEDGIEERDYIIQMAHEIKQATPSFLTAYLSKYVNGIVDAAGIAFNRFVSSESNPPNSFTEAESRKKDALEDPEENEPSLDPEKDALRAELNLIAMSVEDVFIYSQYVNDRLQNSTNIDERKALLRELRTLLLRVDLTSDPYIPSPGPAMQQPVPELYRALKEVNIKILVAANRRNYAHWNLMYLRLRLQGIWEAILSYNTQSK